jgi:plastocyanin
MPRAACGIEAEVSSPNRRLDMKLYSIAVIAALSAALTLAGGAAARPSAVSATTVRVTAKDFFFRLSTKTVPHGRVTFVIKNASSAVHNFEITGHKSKMIGPGKTTRLTVTLKRGRYPYKCTVDSHAQLGMKGLLRVT